MEHLSGGELQRFAIAVVAAQEGAALGGSAAICLVLHACALAHCPSGPSLINGR